jgi:predicted transposase YdaD
MAGKPFDATLKDLIEADPTSWARRFLPGGVRSATLVDADISSLTAAADKVIRAETDDGPVILNIEAEGRHAADAPGRLLLYGVVLRHRHELPVHSVVLLLRREAHASGLTGVLEVQRPGEAVPYLTFRYQVVRLWQEPMQPLLEGGLGTLPLAVLTDEAAADLRGTVRAVDERARGQTSPAGVGTMRTAMTLLLGMRYDEEVIVSVMSELTSLMEESSGYKWIARREQLRGVQRFFLQQATNKLGPPDEATRARVEAITDMQRLDELGNRVLTANSWDELLGPA